MARGIGVWASDLMGLPGDQATAYSRALECAFVRSGPSDLALKLQADFQAKGLSVSCHRIEEAINRQCEVARRKVALRVWSKKPGDGGWERRIFPRVRVPPQIVLPPVLKNWLDRHHHFHVLGLGEHAATSLRRPSGQLGQRPGPL